MNSNVINRRNALLAAPFLIGAIAVPSAANAETSTSAAPSSTRTCAYPLKPLRKPVYLGPTSVRYRRGSRGQTVKNIQNVLNHAPKLKSASGKWYRPCPLKEDGVFGAGTETRVKDGQRALGLTPDGVVGPATKKGYYSWAN